MTEQSMMLAIPLLLPMNRKILALALVTSTQVYDRSSVKQYENITSFGLT